MHVFVMALERMESILTQLSDIFTQEYIAWHHRPTVGLLADRHIAPRSRSDQKIQKGVPVHLPVFTIYFTENL